jgi:hypothetical protein
VGDSRATENDRCSVERGYQEARGDNEDKEAGVEKATETTKEQHHKLERCVEAMNTLKAVQRDAGGDFKEARGKRQILDRGRRDVEEDDRDHEAGV